MFDCVRSVFASCDVCARLPRLVLRRREVDPDDAPCRPGHRVCRQPEQPQRLIDQVITDHGAGRPRGLAPGLPDRPDRSANRIARPRRTVDQGDLAGASGYPNPTDDSGTRSTTPVRRRRREPLERLGVAGGPRRRRRHPDRGRPRRLAWILDDQGGIYRHLGNGGTACWAAPSTSPSAPTATAGSPTAAVPLLAPSEDDHRSDEPGRRSLAPIAKPLSRGHHRECLIAGVKPRGVS